MLIELLEIVITGGQNRIELITDYLFEEVSANTVILFDMGEDGLDGGASSELFMLLLVGGVLFSCPINSWRMALASSWASQKV